MSPEHERIAAAMMRLLEEQTIALCRVCEHLERRDLSRPVADAALELTDVIERELPEPGGEVT